MDGKCLPVKLRGIVLPFLAGYFPFGEDYGPRKPYKCRSPRLAPNCRPLAPKP